MPSEYVFVVHNHIPTEHSRTNYNTGAYGHSAEINCGIITLLGQIWYANKKNIQAVDDFGSRG